MLKEKIKKIIKYISKAVIVGGFIFLQINPMIANAVDIVPYELSEECITYYKDERFVVIEAGHMGVKQGLDCGAIAVDGRYESNMNLELSKLIKKELEKQNIKVEIIRDKDEFISLGQKVKKTNELKPDLSIQTHFNSNINKDATGSEIFYNTAFHDKYGRVIAKETNEIIGKALVIKAREVQETPYYNKNIEAPSLLLETCFISNKEDLQKYDNNKNTLAKKIADKINSFLK